MWFSHFLDHLGVCGSMSEGQESAIPNVPVESLDPNPSMASMWPSVDPAVPEEVSPEGERDSAGGKHARPV